MVFVAQHIEAPASGNRSGLVAPPPGSSSPFVRRQGEPRILAPGKRRASDAGSYESPFERTRRLQQEGILPLPIPPPVKKSEVDRFLDTLAGDVRQSDGRYAPVQMRLELNFGSWLALLPPLNTFFVEDFSYGFAGLWNVKTFDRAESGWQSSLFVGPSFTIYNGGVYVLQEDIYALINPLYADYNSLEAGAAAGLVREQHYSERVNIGYEVRADLLPARWVRTRFSTLSEPPQRSEATSHFRINTMGAALTVAAQASVSRVAGVGAFMSVATADPLQIRTRFGISFFMTSAEELPPKVAPASTTTPAPQSKERKP